MTGATFAQICLADYDGPPQAITCALFACPVCRHPVHSVPAPGHMLSGYVLWWDHHGPPRQQLGPFIVHRPECMNELVRQVTDTADPRWTGSGYSRELAEFVTQLAYNTSQPFPAADRDHRLVIPESP